MLHFKPVRCSTFLAPSSKKNHGFSYMEIFQVKTRKKSVHKYTEYSRILRYSPCPAQGCRCPKLFRITSRDDCLSRKVKVCNASTRNASQGHQQGLTAFTSGTLHSDLSNIPPFWSGTNWCFSFRDRLRDWL